MNVNEPKNHMRQQGNQSNYLAKTQASEYDNLFRRINGLANVWLDHNACILKSKQISLLVTYIEEGRFFKPIPPATRSILSTQEYFLGQFIQIVFTLQDEKTSGEAKKRLRANVEKILEAFDRIKLENPITPNVDLNKLSESAEAPEQESKESGKSSEGFWKRILNFFK